MATVTSAAAQPSVIGREIHRLARIGRKLVPLYGDYGGNTGPLAIASLDLDTQVMGPTEVTLETEELWTARVVDGALWTPYVDPRGNGDPATGQYATTDGDGTWTVHTNVDPVPSHVFDVAATSDGLWLFGAIEYGGVNAGPCIWRSTDGGASWALSWHQDEVTGSDRVYTVWQIGDELVAFVRALTSRALRWSGAGWVDITADMTGSDTPPTGGHGFTYNDGPTSVPYFLGSLFRKEQGSVGAGGKMVMLLPEHESHRAAVEAAIPPGTLFDEECDEAGSVQYALVSGPPTVWRSVGFGAFEQLFTIDDPTVRCMAVDTTGGWLYFGTTDSRILRTPIPA